MTDATEGLDAGVRRMVDEQAVRGVVVRYFVGVDRLDPDLIGSTYHPDAIDDRGRHTFEGATAGPDIVASNTKSMTSTRHHVTSQLVELDGEHARCETYCLGVHVTAGDTPQRMQTASRYLDDLEKRDGEWRFVRRRSVMDFIRLSSLDDEGRGRR
jgi:hypothetical protein